MSNFIVDPIYFNVNFNIGFRHYVRVMYQAWLRTRTVLSRYPHPACNVQSSASALDVEASSDRINCGGQASKEVNFTYVPGVS